MSSKIIPRLSPPRVKTSSIELPEIGDRGSPCRIAQADHAAGVKTAPWEVPQKRLHGWERRDL